jgi:hypothetical protein
VTKGEASSSVVQDTIRCTQAGKDLRAVKPVAVKEATGLGHSDIGACFTDAHAVGDKGVCRRHGLNADCLSTQLTVRPAVVRQTGRQIC